ALPRTAGGRGAGGQLMSAATTTTTPARPRRYGDSHDDGPPPGRAVDLRLLRRLAGRLRGHGRALLVSIAMLPFMAGFEVAQPYLLKRALDEHSAPHRIAGLDRLGLLYLLGPLGRSLASVLPNYLVLVLGR